MTDETDHDQYYIDQNFGCDNRGTAFTGLWLWAIVLAGAALVWWAT